MKIIAEKHNHLDKVWRKVCHNCGSTLEYNNGDIINNLFQKPFILCPVCRAMIPHKPEEWVEIIGSKFDTTEQPTPEECEWLPPLDLGELLLTGGINVDQKFMRRDGEIALFVRYEIPRGLPELIMMVGGDLYRYNRNGVRLEWSVDHWREVGERGDDIIYMIKD